jgi:ferredoxin-fold anticodon binding domain-containing protein
LPGHDEGPADISVFVETFAVFDSELSCHLQRGWARRVRNRHDDVDIASWRPLRDGVRKAIAKAARAAVGNAFALESVEIFDVYRGEGLPAGHKSLAFSLVFRAEDRTLTDEEVNRVFTAVQEGLVSGHGYTLRK